MARNIGRVDYVEKLRQIEKEVTQTDERIAALKEKRAQLLQEKETVEDRAFKAILKEKKLTLQQASAIIQDFMPNAETPIITDTANAVEEKDVPAAIEISKGENNNNDTQSHS